MHLLVGECVEYWPTQPFVRNLVDYESQEKNVIRPWVGNAVRLSFVHMRHKTGATSQRAGSRRAPGVQPPVCEKSADRDIFHITFSPATSVDSPVGSPVGGEAEKPQGVRVLRGGPVSIVIYPTPPSTTASNEMLPRTGQSGPTFASLADETAADDMGVLLMGRMSRANSPTSSKKRAVRGSGRTSPFRRSRASSADSRSRKSNTMQSVTLKMPSRAFEVDIKLEKVLKDATARSPNQLPGRADMVGSTETNGEKANSIRCYKHTISSLISSRIADMNRESRMLQESDCKRKGAHRPQRPPAPPAHRIANSGSMRCLYDSYSKHVKRQPRQFSFH